MIHFKIPKQLKTSLPIDYPFTLNWKLSWEKPCLRLRKGSRLADQDYKVN